MQVLGRQAGGALVAVVALASLLGGSARAGDQDWHESLEAGVSAARQSGKPLLVITAWRSGI